MNNTLPISNYKKEIMQAVANHAVTIITAETGSGKSTQVPQFLYEAGYQVIVTEPRRMAAWSLAERVAEEIKSSLGEIVGFRTGFERKDSTNTSILYCTDGLELVREITDTKDKRKVLIIDEVHEWNLNIETLVAWSKKKINEGWNTKVVIMSATLEKESLTKYFGEDAYLLNVPGKIFPVEFSERYENELIPTVKDMILDKHNTLVFVPGKKEISNVIEELSFMNDSAVILPLHGKLDSEEQKKCFEAYSIPKVIVATNVAQTSITIPDIDAVVDTGKERRLEVHDGIQGLFLRNISKADCMQRKGRAGRTKEGKYILCSDSSFDSRTEFSVPEIQRGILNQIVLRLATCGIDALELEFFHQPNDEALILAKQTLINLGAIKPNNKVTEIGYKMAKMPVSVETARMIIEAEKYGVTEDVICIAAILEVGTLLDYRPKKGLGGCQVSYYNFTSENQSDLLAEYDVWKNISKLKYIDFKELSINKKSYFRIKELIKKMYEVLEGIVTISSSGDREAIKKSCLAGMINHVYKYEHGEYINGDGKPRNLDNHSCLSGWNNPKLLVGIPKIIEFKDSWGWKRTMDLVCMATKVTVGDLKEIAPDFVTQKDIDAYYSCSADAVKVTRKTYFRDILIDEKEEVIQNHPDYERLKEIYENENKKENYYESIYQRTVIIDGKQFEVSYDWKQKASITIDEYTLYHTEVKEVILDNGKKVEVYYCGSCCHSKRNTNIVALRNAVENDRVRKCFERKRENLPRLKSNTIKSALELIEYIGKQEVTCGNGGYGEPIYGFGCFVLEKNSLHLELLEDEEKAEENTQEAIEFLYGKFIRENFYDKKFKFKKGVKGLSPKEQKVKSEFDSEVQELLRGLNISNIEENVTYLEELYSILIEDLKIVA